MIDEIKTGTPGDYGDYLAGVWRISVDAAELM
jgi:hypothetical protein